MFEILTNLILTSLFLQSQVDEQMTITAASQEEYQLTPAELRQVQSIAPQRMLDSDSVGVDVTANSVMVADKDTGKILYEKKSSEKRSIASLTKLMTALVFVDNNPGWERRIEILESDQRAGGIVYLIPGEEFVVRDVFFAALVASANEGAAALARSTGLSTEDFVKKMNEKAQELGMRSSHFVDVTGLSGDNISTATDVIILLNTALGNTDIARAISTDEYNLYILNNKSKRRIASTDLILGDTFGIDGEFYLVEAGKTGYLERAGYCFVSQIVNRYGQRILTVVLGSDTILDRFNDTKSLAYWVFNNYSWR